jgi:hypothetical protein
MNKMPSLDDLKKVLKYDSESGIFTWITGGRYNRLAGQVAGSVCDEYIKITLSGIRWKAHRLAWKMFYGTDPAGEIDHINGNKHDNRICNLRDCKKSDNGKNAGLSKRNKSGFRGVTKHTGREKWIASISLDGKNKHLGVFDSPEEAGEVAALARSLYYGEFSGNNRLNSGS